MNYSDLSLSLADALLRSHGSERPAPGSEPAAPPFTIAISREAGALGNSVAVEVGRRLGWPVYDRNILDRIAEEMHRPPSHLEGVDERPVNWLGECLAGLFDKYHVGSDAYVKYLFAAVRGLGAAGRCVIVGRGANFILPPQSTLSVRLVARPEDRVAAVARRLGLSEHEAAAWVKTTERERLAFVNRTFQRDPTDPLHYDLVLNLSRLTVEEAADIILEALNGLERRGAKASRGRERPEAAGRASPALT